MTKLMLFVLLALSAVVGTTPGRESGDGGSFNFVVKSARSGDILSGVRLEVETAPGRWYFADSSSSTFTLSNEVLGRRGRISHPGFLTHTFFIRYEEFLIEDDSEYPAQYTQDVVFGGGGYRILLRVPEGAQVVLAPERRWYENQRFRNAIDLAAAKLQAAAYTGRVSVTVEESEALSESLNRVVVPVYEDPSDPIWRKPGYENAGAVTYWDIRQGVVAGGKILFKDVELFWGPYLPIVLMHEGRHVLGLVGHSPLDQDDLTLLEYSNFERQALRNIFLRPPRTRALDDSAVSTTTTTERKEVSRAVICVVRVSH